ncbi:MAG: cytochrome c [Vicinamibacterales bacterium]
MKVIVRSMLLLLAVGAVVGAVMAYTIVSRGLSTRVAPSAVESALARTMRYLATPGQVRGRNNPVVLTDEARSNGMEHFADHCAGCHANDGSGDTGIGRALYPPAPDMRAAATQRLSDGELFSIIENGIRLTGMPAWGTGTAEGERASWALVHFIRQLTTLTPDDIERMEARNPRTPGQFQEEEAARRFLAGEDAPPAQGPAAFRQGGHHE